jgi:hypothetical protein
MDCIFCVDAYLLPDLESKKITKWYACICLSCFCLLVAIFIPGRKSLSFTRSSLVLLQPFLIFYVRIFYLMPLEWCYVWVSEHYILDVQVCCSTPAAPICRWICLVWPGLSDSGGVGATAGRMALPRTLPVSFWYTPSISGSIVICDTTSVGVSLPAFRLMDLFWVMWCWWPGYLAL